MPYKPKMTPKAASRARATSKAQAQTRRQMASPGRTTDAGAGSIPVSAVRAGTALAKAIGRQNTAARTYITKKAPSAAQVAAAARSSARMKKVNSKARTFNKAVTAAGGTGAAVGFIAGQTTQKRVMDDESMRRKREEQRARNKTKAQRKKR